MDIKKRLDQLILEKYPSLSRTQIQDFIHQGKVKVNDKIVTKPGTKFDTSIKIILEQTSPKYVSRAGFKLEKALEYFKIDPKNLVILDAGLSTGGFSDCLLQHNVKKIYGVDVGHGQVHEKIKSDPRIIVMEKTNLKDLVLQEQVDLVTLDLSFISLLKVIESVYKNIKKSGQLITLIKPQFEAPDLVSKSGIIKDPKIHKKVLDQVISGIKSFEFKFMGVIESPITGSDGNKEFLAYFVKI